MVGAHGAHGIPLEVVGTVMEMADVAWFALEHRPGRHRKAVEASPAPGGPDVEEDNPEMARLRMENLRLRAQLADNLALLQGLYKAPAVSHDCPPDIYERLTAAANNSSFLAKLESLHQESKAIRPACLTSEDNTESNVVDVPIDVDGELSWWVWVTDQIEPESLEEISEIDEENYVVINEENVVDGIANFIARCIIGNPQSKMLSSEDLHRAITKALVKIKDRNKWKHVWEAGRVIYTLSTWGIALAGLYRHRAILKMAAKGVGASAKLAVKML